MIAMRAKLMSTEQVSKYHPDKVADQISDAIVTECLRVDKNSRVAIETAIKGNQVILLGEISTKADTSYDNLARIVRRVLNKLNYSTDIRLLTRIQEQSPEIRSAVDKEGAGDQGMMYGMATKETDSLLPYGFDVANKIIKIIEDDVATGNGPLLGDAKTQVTTDLNKKGYKSLVTIVVSACHKPSCALEAVREHIAKLLISNGVIKNKKDIELVINPAGSWSTGGPEADAGLTGRKIVCDQYGGYSPVGGGAFSGKDPTKVDRSGAYMARRIAVDILSRTDATRVAVQLAYAIGVAEPVSVYLESDLNEEVNEKLTKEILAEYDLTPKGIIKFLDLLNVDYEHLAKGCHYRDR